MGNVEKWALWKRWVAANAAGELAGLGSTFALIAFYSIYLGDQQTTVAILLAFLFAVASGALEATVVGLAQWWAMHPGFPSVSRGAWWRGTLAGALAAYVLGYMPSTLMNLSEAGAQTTVTEPPQVVVLALAAGLGAVAGAVLSFGQWLAWRKTVRGAGWWIPANMLAWAAGMPLIFLGIDMAQKGLGLGQVMLLMAATLLVTGALVGAIHGLFLVKIARINQQAECIRVAPAGG